MQSLLTVKTVNKLKYIRILLYSCLVNYVRNCDDDGRLASSMDGVTVKPEGNSLKRITFRMKMNSRWLH